MYKRQAEYLEEPIERLKLITCHLGNGSSIAAVDQGKVDLEAQRLLDEMCIRDRPGSPLLRSRLPVSP